MNEKQVNNILLEVRAKSGYMVRASVHISKYELVSCMIDIYFKLKSIESYFYQPLYFDDKTSNELIHMLDMIEMTLDEGGVEYE